MTLGTVDEGKQWEKQPTLGGQRISCVSSGIGARALPGQAVMEG